MSKFRAIGAASSLVCAAAAFAQPTTFTDLGDHASASNTGSTPVTLIAANDIQWFRIVLPSVSSNSGYVDLWTNGPGDMTDTEIGVYDNTGALKASDDDDGPGLASALSFGATTPTRAATTGVAPYTGAGTAYNGRDGTLSFGTHWIAVGRFNVTFNATNWSVTSANANSERTTTLAWAIQLGLPGTPPTGVGSNVTMLPGSSGRITVTVTPGSNPTSTGITVTADTTSVGGAAGTMMFDDGATGGDVTAGDLVYTTTITAPATEGNYNVPFVVADSLTRSSGGTIVVSSTTPPSWTEVADADQVFGSAQAPVGSGALDSIDGSVGGANDLADMFKIEICDFSNFSATTNHTRTGTQDTQLFLFDSTGHGVEANDDGAGVGLNSFIHNEFVTANGTYYVAVSHYDVDPVNASALEIWADTPFGTVRAPDGPGASDTIATGWNSTFATAFPYRIRFTGTCFPAAGCAADFNHDAVVDFFDYLDFVQAFAANAPEADFNRDGVIDFFDYLDFVQAFAAGC